MYNYQKLRPTVFTERSVEIMLCILHFLGKRQKEKLTREDIMHAPGVTGDSWEIMAVIDYLEERRRIVKLADGAAMQHDLFLVV